MYDDVSLYFSDIVGFTTIGKKSTPSQIMVMMDSLFHLFDDIISNFNCQKVETIGDAYFVVSGCPEPHEDHAAEIARFALGTFPFILSIFIIALFSHSQLLCCRFSNSPFAN